MIFESETNKSLSLSKTECMSEWMSDLILYNSFNPVLNVC